jgi:hypothetical protein
MLQCLDADVTVIQAYAHKANNYKKKFSQDIWFASVTQKCFGLK